jgi:hypothetical protein
MLYSKALHDPVTHLTNSIDDTIPSMATGLLACRLLIRCAMFFAMAGIANAETRALLIGVSSYQHLSEVQHLSAPRNDVVQMRELLVQRGIKRKNITVLSDPRKPLSRMNSAERNRLPTRQRILDEMAALVDKARSGDFVVVYMSGHGSFQPDQSNHPDEDDGVDEVFLPYDVEISSPDGSARTIKNGIVDDELGRYATAIRQKGADIWLMLDTCHSGTGARTNSEARSKFIEPAVLGVRVQEGRATKRTPNQNTPLDAMRSGTPPQGRAAFLYASQADEIAVELPLPLTVSRRKAVYRSAFTHALVLALARRPNLTYRQLVDEANRLMRDFGGRLVRQTAGQDGDLVDDPVIGGASNSISPTQQWSVYGSRMMAGLLHGVERGAIVALFVDPNDPDERAKGHAEVATASASEARLMPIREYPCPQVGGNPKCRPGGSDVMTNVRYARPLAPPRDYTLAISSPRPSIGASYELVELAHTTYAALRSLARGSLSERVRFSDAEPDLVWWVTGHGFRLTRNGVDPALLVTGAGMDLSTADGKEKITHDTIRLMLRAYRVERLRRLAEDPQFSGPDQPRVTLKISARSDANSTMACPAGAGPPIEISRQQVRAQACSVVTAEVTNAARSARYVYVFSIDSDWNLRLRCMDGDTAGAGAVLAPGATRECDVLRYREAGAPDDPHLPNVARYDLLVVSVPRQEGTQGPTFTAIENLNNSKFGLKTRSSIQALLVDDNLAAGQASRGTVGNALRPTIALFAWEVDQRPRK